MRRLAESFSGKRLSQISSFLVEGHKQRRIQNGARVCVNRELAALNRLPRISEFVFAKPNGKPYHAIRGFRAACDRAGLTGVTPHSTRHTFATRLCENGVDLRLVQELGGWATLSLVQRYAHVSPSRKVDAVEGLVRNSTTLFTTAAIQRIGKTA